MQQHSFSQPVAHPNWVDLLRTRADQHPQRIAQTFLSDGEHQEINLSFAALDQRARMIAAALQQHVPAGERALLLYPPGLEFICAFMGCLYAKVVAVPAYPPRRGQMDNRLQGIAQDARPAVILTTAKLRGELQAHHADWLQAAQIHVLASEQLPSELADEWQMPTVNAATLAFLQYTSGSTGAPKGVMISHGNLLHNARWIQASFDHPAEAPAVSWLPEYHDMGLIGASLQPLYLGIRAVRMAPVDFLQKPLRWLQAISTYRAATSGGPNFAYELCLSKITPEQSATLDLHCWTLAFSGAEPVRAATLARFAQSFGDCGFRRQAFYPCYGMAEATLLITGGQRGAGFTPLTVEEAALTEHVVVPAPQPAANQRPRRTLVSCGSVGSDQAVIIVDPYAQQPAAANHVGELWVRGPSVAQGYWNQPELTQASFGAQLANGEGQPYLRTGDLGFFHAGELYITGRLKDVIIIRGRNHYPQDIELSVEQCHPAVRPTCSAAFSVDLADEERLVIACEVDRHYLHSLNVDEVTTAIRHTVAAQHGLQTAAILLLRTTTLPKTSSGKIQRYACRKGFIKNTLEVVGGWRHPDIDPQVE